MTASASRLATMDDLSAIKVLAEQAKQELGFVPRGALRRAIERDEVVVIESGGAVAGFCHLYRRRDGIVTIYHLAVDPAAQRRGLGRALIAAVERQASASDATALRLKCPASLPANHFYAKAGFRLIGREPGKHASLAIWEHTIVVSNSPEVPTPSHETCDRQGP